MNSVESVGIELGTSKLVIFNETDGLLFEGPSALAVNRVKEEIYAVGENALAMLGKEPANIEVVRPMSTGNLEDAELMGILLGHYVGKTVRKRWFTRTRAVISSSARLNNLDKKFFIRNLISAGLGKIWFIERPLAAAVGARADVSDDRANLVIDIGSATSSIAIVARNQVVKEVISIGGDAFTEKIIEQINLATNVHIGRVAAENIKMESAVGMQSDAPKIHKVVGKNVLANRPEWVSVDENQINASFDIVFDKLERDIRLVFEGLSREHNSDIRNNGIILTGGGAKLNGLDQMIANRFNINCRKIEPASLCVANGCAIAADNPGKFAALFRR